MNRFLLRPSLIRLRSPHRSSYWENLRRRSIHVQVLPNLSVSAINDLNTGIVFDYGDTEEDGEKRFFLEEPIDLTAEQGFGFLEPSFGEHIGPHGRYKILRKIGWGKYASGWLAKDTAEHSFVSIKALTGHATTLFKEGLICDLSVLHRISNQNRDTTETHCLPLQSHFIQPRKGTGDSDHLCLVTNPLGPSIIALAYSQEPSLLCVKKVFRDILKGLDYIHGLGIVHTDIHPTNITMDLGNNSTGFDIKSYMERNPARMHPLKETYTQSHLLKKVYRDYKFTQLAVSQPFPASEFRDWQSGSFIISDFGAAQFIDRKVSDDITEIEMRAPEVILGLPWDEKVDIWSFGCSAFEFLFDNHLFDAVEDGWDPEKLLLHQMLSFTGQRFSSDVIHASKRGTEFLDSETGLLKDGTKPIKRSLSDIVKSEQYWKKNPIDGFDVFLQKCL